EAARWPEPVGLSFNLSIHDLGSSEELERVLETIRHSGVHPARIDLEITETAVFSDMVQLQRAAGQLRGLGCGVSLDDFGTGFSSLSQLLALRSEEHTSELQSRENLVCRLLLEKKNRNA